VSRLRGDRVVVAIEADQRQRIGLSRFDSSRLKGRVRQGRQGSLLLCQQRGFVRCLPA
jgi:hypothetical protein